MKSPLRNLSGRAGAGRTAALLFLGALAFGRLAAQVVDAPAPELLSRQPGNANSANGSSRFPAINSLNFEGQFTAFESDATDLDPDDDDNLTDIYLHELSTSRISLISHANRPEIEKGRSFDVSLSDPAFAAGGGILGVFTTGSANLDPMHPDDDRGPAGLDVYLFRIPPDFQSEVEFELLSRDPLRQVSGNGISQEAEISALGDIVAFSSLASNLVQQRIIIGDNEVIGVIDGVEVIAVIDGGGVIVPAGGGPVPPRYFEIHILFVANNAMIRVPNFLKGVNGDSVTPDVSANGQTTVFATESTGFVTTDVDRVSDIIVFDFGAGLELASIDPDTGEKFDGPSRFPRIDARGQRVAFVTQVKGVDQVYVRDRELQTTVLVSVRESGATGGPIPANSSSMLGDISADGLAVIFSTADNLTADDTNNSPDVYLRDLARGRTILLSRSPRTFLATGDSPLDPFFGSVTDITDGVEARTAIFHSPSPDLVVPGVSDLNQTDDVFVVRVPPEDSVAQTHSPSNQLHLVLQGQGAAGPTAVRHVGLNGSIGTSPSSPVQDFGGLAVDGENVLWVVDAGTVRRLEARSLDVLAEIDVPEINVGPIHDMVAFDRAAFIALGNLIVKVSSQEQGDPPLVRTLPETPDSVNLASDPQGRLWAGLRQADSYTIVAFTTALQPLGHIERNFPDNEPGVPYTLMAIDAEGRFLLRSPIELALLGRNGNLGWRNFLPPGDGLAVDSRGNSAVVAAREITGFSPEGNRLFSVPVDPDIDLSGRVHLVLDGNQSLWLLAEGNSRIQRIARPFFDDGPDGSRTFDLAPGILGDQKASDVTGFLAASVSARDLDSDGDIFSNQSEVDQLQNPFNPFPPVDGRFPPIQDVEATVVDNSVVLEWTAPIIFCDYLITRNGREVEGQVSAVLTEVDRFSLTDASPAGGINHYVIIGIGDCGIVGRAALLAADKPGGGAGGAPPESSAPGEATVVFGEGEVADTAVILFGGGDPTAIAVDESSDPVVVLTAVGGSLVKLEISDGTLTETDEIPLPADPFISETITGLEFDPDDNTFVYILLQDGRFYRQQLGVTTSPATAAFDLDDPPGNVPPGYDFHEYYGLANRDGTLLTIQNSISYSISEPGIECLIGFKPSGGTAGTAFVRNKLAGENGVFTGRDLKWAGGLALLDTDGNRVITGLGASTSTIDETSVIDVTDAGGGNLTLAAGNSSLPLDTATFNVIFDFTYVNANDENLLVIAASDSEVALVNASFPPVQQIDFDPGRAKWDTTPVDLELTVSYGNTGKLFENLSLAVFVDGVETAPSQPPVVDAGASEATIQINLDESPKHTRNYTVSVHSTEGSFTREVPLGFIRGDANNDGTVDVSDSILILILLFIDGALTPACPDAANVDDSIDIVTGKNTIELTDAVLLLSYLYNGGPPPASPFPNFGLDKTADDTVKCSE